MVEPQPDAISLVIGRSLTRACGGELEIGKLTEEQKAAGVAPPVVVHFSADTSESVRAKQDEIVITPEMIDAGRAELDGVTVDDFSPASVEEMLCAAYLAMRRLEPR